MKTIYIDVYFMLNFTVDILAVFIALKLVNVKASVRKLILSGILGGTYSIIELFVNIRFVNILISVCFLLSICYVCCRRVSFVRKIRFIISFYLSSLLIGGGVSYIYNLLDKYFDKININASDASNRRILIFSLIILVIIGVLRLFIMVFSQSINEKNIKISIEVEDKKIEVDALVDTGNLVKDPMNMNPVIFIKKSIAVRLFPREVTELEGIDGLSNKYRKRIRLIPVSKSGITHVVTGIKVDKIKVIRTNSKAVEIDATIAIDKEEGTYGGYYALAPYIAACHD